MDYTPRRTPRHEEATLRGVRHHVTRWGPPGRPPLVFLHGWADAGPTFQFLVDAFGRDLPVVAPDWRGFGRSAWNDGPYWFPDYLADLDALLDLYSPDAPATIVGHSMGGNVAGLYAGVRPERVARFVNLEGFGMPRTDPADAPDRYRRWLDELRAPPSFGRFASLEQFAHVLHRRNPGLSAAQATFVAREWSRPAADGGVEVRHDPAHKLANPVLYRREETEACWRRCTAPTLLVLGGRSKFLAHLGADGTDECFRRLVRDLRIVRLPEAGHMLHHDEPAAVAALIESFLAETGWTP